MFEKDVEHLFLERAEVIPSLLRNIQCPRVITRFPRSDTVFLRKRRCASLRGFGGKSRCIHTSLTSCKKENGSSWDFFPSFVAWVLCSAAVRKLLVEVFAEPLAACAFLRDGLAAVPSVFLGFLVRAFSSSSSSSLRRDRRDERLEAREERDAASSSLSSGTMKSSSSESVARRAANKSIVMRWIRTPWMEPTFFLWRLLELAQGLREGRYRTVVIILFYECVIFQNSHASLLRLP